jgi:hypothetical protein
MTAGEEKRGQDKGNRGRQRKPGTDGTLTFLAPRMGNVPLSPGFSPRTSVPGFQSSDFLPADLLRDNSAPSSDANPTDSFQEPHRSRPDIPAQFRRLALYCRDFRTDRRSACLRVCSVRGASEVIKHGKAPLSAGCAFHCKDHSAKFVTCGCVSRAVKTTGRVECNGAPGIPTALVDREIVQYRLDPPTARLGRQSRPGEHFLWVMARNNLLASFQPCWLRRNDPAAGHVFPHSRQCPHGSHIPQTLPLAMVLLTFGPGHWFWPLAVAVQVGPKGVQRSFAGSPRLRRGLRCLRMKADAEGSLRLLGGGFVFWGAVAAQQLGQVLGEC